ncbi:uncharacterized protein LOC126372512 isoform X1 [Pectinophora gossypiella]|uniref:uncharacterized protein LOC126372512 isoform X1 n=1 Tax=Pectinophora gossypiella TaxID=13191 RepID=UPI00214EDBC6|nr:uncharacterized protein LOC126372512 isoform X1 [Pectinophora gossypiella]XP_049874282.1 uncharacterized protein LOC126372512 isoform X1 [Pectinophora gossypiella]
MDMDFPKMPEMKFKEIKMPEMKFPKMPEMKFPEIPKIDPITTHGLRNHLPEKGENFVGYATSSFSSSSDVNGVKSSIGGSNVILNNNGKVDEENIRFQGGDKRKGEAQGKGFFKHSKVKPLKPMKPFKHAKPNLDKIRTHIPDKTENFVAFSSSSVSHSTIINGKKTHAAASQTLLNNNGKVDEETVVMNSSDTANKNRKDDDGVTVEDEE